MDTTKFVIILSIIIVSLFGFDCQAKRKGIDLPVIKFTETRDTFRLTDRFPNIRCLQLGSCSDTVMGRVKKVIDAEGYLVVLSETYSGSNNNMIGMFDRYDGRFYRQLGSQGEGPEDYINAADICYNPEERTIMVLDNVASEFISYRMNGQFAGRNKPDVSDSNMISMARASDGTILTCNFLLSGIAGQSAFSIIRPDWIMEENVDPFVPVVIPQHGLGRRVVEWGGQPMSVSGNEIKFVKFLTDSLFSIKNGELTPLYKLKFGRKKLNKKLANNVDPKFSIKLTAYLRNNNKMFSYVYNMFETSEYIVIVPDLYDLKGYYWIDKKNGTGFHISPAIRFGLEFLNVMEGKTIINISGANDDEIISCFMAEDIPDLTYFEESDISSGLPDEVISGIRNVDPEGNPFLIIYSH